MTNVMRNSKIYLLVVAILFVGSGCIHTRPEPIIKPIEPTVIVVVPQEVPYKVENGTVIPWDCYFVLNTDLLILMDEEWIKPNKVFKKGDICDKLGYILHDNIVEKKFGKIRLRE